MSGERMKSCGGICNVGWGTFDYLSGISFSGTQSPARDYRQAYRAWARRQKWYNGGTMGLGRL